MRPEYISVRVLRGRAWLFIQELHNVRHAVLLTYWPALWASIVLLAGTCRRL